MGLSWGIKAVAFHLLQWYGLWFTGALMAINKAIPFPVHWKKLCRRIGFLNAPILCACVCVCTYTFYMLLCLCLDSAHSQQSAATNNSQGYVSHTCQVIWDPSPASVLFWWQVPKTAGYKKKSHFFKLKYKRVCVVIPAHPTPCKWEGVRVLHVGSTNRVPPEVLGRHFKHLPLLIYIDIKVLVANFVTNSLAWYF